jgi:hypothetical protein
MRESLKDFRLHHHLGTNEIKIVPADVHSKVAHIGERAATSVRLGLRGVGGAAKLGLRAFAIGMVLESPGSVIAAPLGGETEFGDA